MTPSINSLNIAKLRDFYEEQGRSAQAAGGFISCSEAPNTAAVIRMATEHADDFRTLIDVGCGANLISDQAIAALGKQVTGIDFTWSFLTLAPSDSPVTVLQGDAMSLPFIDGAFDAAICSETLEHIPDDVAVVKELWRVLRAEGWLFLTVPNLWSAARIIGMAKQLDPRIHLMPGHLREYSLKKVSYLLAGQFEIKKIYPVGFGWAGSSIGGRIEKLIESGILSRYTKSIAVAARKVNQL